MQIRFFCLFPSVSLFTKSFNLFCFCFLNYLIFNFNVKGTEAPFMVDAMCVCVRVLLLYSAINSSYSSHMQNSNIENFFLHSLYCDSIVFVCCCFFVYLLYILHEMQHSVPTVGGFNSSQNEGKLNRVRIHEKKVKKKKRWTNQRGKKKT